MEEKKMHAINWYESGRSYAVEHRDDDDAVIRRRYGLTESAARALAARWVSDARRDGHRVETTAPEY